MAHHVNYAVDSKWSPQTLQPRLLTRWTQSWSHLSDLVALPSEPSSSKLSQRFSLPPRPRKQMCMCKTSVTPTERFIVHSCPNELLVTVQNYMCNYKKAQSFPMMTLMNQTSTKCTNTRHQRISAVYQVSHNFLFKNKRVRINAAT